MSITPPSKMPLIERIGGLLIGIGLLALFVNMFTGGKVDQIMFKDVSDKTGEMWGLIYNVSKFIKGLKLLFALVPIAVAGVLASKDFQRFKIQTIILGSVGLLGLVLFQFDFSTPNALMFVLVFILPSIGGILYAIGAWGQGSAGIKNNGIFHYEGTRKNGSIAWILTIVFTGFYVLYYWFPQALYGLAAAADPLVYAISGHHSVENGEVKSLEFVYSGLYTFLVLVMGVRFIIKYRHNKYQIIRTISVAFFQLVLAFLLPAFLLKMKGEGHNVYLSYFWPLGYYNLYPWFLDKWSLSAFFKFAILWGVILSFVAVPVLTYFFGKRWYCSWVCGCGGLAETAGDSYRHLSDKSLKAWRIERISIYSVLVLVTLSTAVILLNYKFEFLPGHISDGLQKGYGFVIGSIFAGVVGTGFYPIMGNRVWCRFGCPQAALLGILQKYFSRFRITTNGSQCISCGNCSTYCEMGIDVKWYAQRGQNIVRASCVGCGICSAVCPRGVLKLENGPMKGRMNEGGPISLNGGKVTVEQ